MGGDCPIEFVAAVTQRSDTEKWAIWLNVAALHTSSAYIPCDKVGANPWEIFGEPVAEVCYERCIQPHVAAVGRGDKAAAEAAWNGVLAARAETTAWLGSGTACSNVQDFVSCGNERVRTGMGNNATPILRCGACTAVVAGAERMFTVVLNLL